MNILVRYCPNCRTENEDGSIFCKNCGKRLAVSPVENNNSKNNILIAIIIALLLILAMVGTYAFIILNDTEENTNTATFNKQPTSDVKKETPTTEDTKSWHSIGTFSGVGDDIITFTGNGNKFKVVSSAMPLKNYADNYMITTVSSNGNVVGSSELAWNSKSAVAKKSKTIEFTGTGACEISISAYELDYWNIEVYEYY